MPMELRIVSDTKLSLLIAPPNNSISLIDTNYAHNRSTFLLTGQPHNISLSVVRVLCPNDKFGPANQFPFITVLGNNDC